MSLRVFYGIGFVIIVAVLGALLGWYVFIGQQQKEAARVVEGRGFTTSIPEFTKGTGSMRENLVSVFERVASGDFRVTPSNTSSAATSARSAPRLRQVSAVPSTGLADFMVGSERVVRYVERPTGNIFEVSIDGDEPKRLTNTLIPHVYAAEWVDEDSLVVRHSDDRGVTIQSFLASIKKSTTTDSGVGTLAGSYLDKEVFEVAVSPDTKNPLLFYLLKTDKETYGIYSDRAGKNPKRVFTSPLSGWRASWRDNDSIVLFQKAAHDVPGSAYDLSIKTGALKRIEGDKEGLLVAVHPSENVWVYSTAKKGTIALFARINDAVTELPVATLAEKCVWGTGTTLTVYCAVPRELPNAVLPDAWYRGETSFEDVWFVIDPVKGAAEAFMDPSEFGVSLDVQDPRLGGDGSRIFFTDVKTGTMWIVTL